MNAATAERVNILRVDDQPGRLLSYESILEELGQNLITARSGEEALQRLLVHEVALILLDVSMPGMDGFETAAFVKQFEGPMEDLVSPHEWSLVDRQVGVNGYGITALAHLKDLVVIGPHNPTGVSETDIRRRIFTCRPTAGARRQTTVWAFSSAATLRTTRSGDPFSSPPVRSRIASASRRSCGRAVSRT